MSEIKAYRQIVELQAEIIRLSEKNAELENRCKEARADLISRHKKFAARKVPARADLDLPSDRSFAAETNLMAVIRYFGVKPVLQRIWQSII